MGGKQTFLGTPTGIGAPRVKGPKELAQTRGPCRQGALQIKGPYTDNGPTRPKSSYIQGAHADKRPLWTMCNSYT